MVKTKDSLEKESQNILDTILPELINRLLKDKKITKEELNDKKLVLEKVLNYLNHNTIEFQFAIDHRKELLKN